MCTHFMTGSSYNPCRAESEGRSVAFFQQLAESTFYFCTTLGKSRGERWEKINWLVFGILNAIFSFIDLIVSGSPGT